MGYFGLDFLCFGHKKRYNDPRHIFLKKIDKHDEENLKLFMDLSLNEADIENQFRILHPETQFITNFNMPKAGYCHKLADLPKNKNHKKSTL